MKPKLLPHWVSRPALLTLIVALAIGAVVPKMFGFSVYSQNQVTETFLFIAAALAWNWMGGYLGQVSFGHSAMFGLGGFVSARILLAIHLPFWLAWIVGGLVAAAFALVWGHPTLRLRGPYFSIATIGVGEATRLIMTYWEDLTGGSSGLSLPITQGLKAELYWWGLGLMGLVIAASYTLRKSTFGLGLLAIKSDVDAAADVGISPTLMQDIVLLLSGFTVGVCGAFYASYQSFIEPGDMFGFDRSISFVLMAVIGGVGTIVGPALGAVVFVMLRQYLIGSYPQLYLGIYGLLLIVVILFEPLGMMGLFFRVARRLHLVRPDVEATLEAKAAVGGGAADPGARQGGPP
jgi:branched-chain amino acid transport system permease protein